MAAKLKLKTVEPGLSPERKALAQAINSRDELKTRLGHLQAAAADMQKEHWGLQHDLDDARKQIEVADTLAVTNEVERRMNWPVVSGMSPNESRQAVDNLEGQLSTIERARQHIDVQMTTMKRDFESASSAVLAAADKVKWADVSVRRTFLDLKTATRTALELRAACNAIGAAPKDLESCLAINPEFSEALAGRWADAMKRLVNDAGAEFPT